ncbi:uncharacterized protein FTOL_09146 [Fusarium torulosum]|uniref:NADP-dependent oxidoreductase domain-containing protein n=1 Tax=Fusarium torulosum TaxID=33205 RepID=A0AAE8SKR7_9HYPO|nr:uncharacterized protein FTOL_09146 [Fusarium torulosum]
MIRPERINIVVGTANFGYPDNFWGQSNDTFVQAFALMKSHGSNKLDTAKPYQGSEVKLGALKAGTEHGLDLDTKWLASYDFTDGANTREYIVTKAKESLEALCVSQVDILYLHSPVHNTQIEETLAGVNDAHKAGMFR